MEIRGQPIKWTTSVTYADQETGEIISKRLAQRDYIIHKEKPKIEYNGNERRKTIVYRCEPNRQGKLW